MRKITILLLPVLIFTSIFYNAFSQTTVDKSSANLPLYVRELLQGPPSKTLLSSDPAYYHYLLDKRVKFKWLLQQAVKEKSLPESILKEVDKSELEENNNSLKTTHRSAAASNTNFHLVKDINQAKSSNPFNRIDDKLQNKFTVYKNYVYYQANDGINGIELWKSNGTAAGTVMVKDIAPGNASSSPSDITAYNSKIYFSAGDTLSGGTLYQSDGTAAGTTPLYDSDGKIIMYAHSFTIVNGKLYFVKIGNGQNSKLWLTDGTQAGTKFIIDLDTSSLNYTGTIAQLTAANNLLFFTAENYMYGRQLWRSDGTAAGTFMLKAISIQDYFIGPAYLTAFDNRLYFSANSGAGYSLWKSDGSISGTIEVENPQNVRLNYSAIAFYGDNPFAIARHSIFFAAYTATTGTELYKYDPSKAQGPVLVKDITPGAASTKIYTESIRALNNNVLYPVTVDSPYSSSIWKSDGTTNNTIQLAILPSSIYGYNTYATDSLLYFPIYTNGDYEPWVCDGTTAGTKLLKNINPVGSSYTDLFTACNGTTYFSAYSKQSGKELWITKGNEATTSLVKDVNTTSTDGSVKTQGVALNSKTLLIAATTPELGTELWKSNGTANGTVLVKDIYPGEISSYPTFLDVKNGKAYFSAFDKATNKINIFVTDGTAANTKSIAAVDGYISNLHVADNGNVFYTLLGQTNSIDLWIADTAGNNIKLKPGVYTDFNVDSNFCVFSTNGNSNKYYLWRTDGKKTSTNRIGSFDFEPINFTPVAGKIVFINSFFLYSTDGTSGGTIQLSSKIFIYSLNNLFTSFKDKLYFNTHEDATGNELYSTDGTVNGTGMASDICEGNCSSGPSNITAGKTKMYYAAADATHGNELWKFYSKTLVSSIVKDITPGIFSSYLRNFVTAEDVLYFLNNDSLWISDGTYKGTLPVSDSTLATLDNYDNLTGVGSMMFLNGKNNLYGNELYVNNVFTPNLTDVQNSSIEVIKKYNLSAQVQTNPFINELKINITSPQQQILKISIINAAGQKISKEIFNASKGDNTLTINSAGWIKGFYIINIISNTEIISLKAIK